MSTGGFGSGRPARQNRETVENCLALDVNRLYRGGSPDVSPTKGSAAGETEVDPAKAKPVRGWDRRQASKESTLL